MKVKLVSSIAWEGQHQEEGRVLDLEDADAHWLINRGRAIEWKESNQIDSDKKAAKPKTRKKSK